MTTPYRSELEALKDRKAALEQEVAHVDTLLEDVERRQKRMLDTIQVASPCNAKWDDMVGDDRVRFCLSCDKNVYNLTALPSDEAERFVQQNAGGQVCVRFYQRADGTVMTADCPVGQKKKRRRKLALAVAGAGALGLAGLSSFERSQRMGEMRVPPQDVVSMQGAVAVPEAPPPVAPLPPPPTTDRRWVAGGLRVAPTPPVTPPKR